MPNLLHYYLALKHKYRSYDTKDALKRMQTLRLIVHEMTEKGYPVAFEILGSINFGIVEPSSDADCILLHSCDLHKTSGECPNECSNLVFEKEEIVRILRRRLKGDAFRIEFLDSINVAYIDDAIAASDLIGNEHIYRLLFYRTVGRPVNRPLFIRFTRALEENEELMRQFADWASEALRAYIRTASHRHSFHKYNERIAARGLNLPDELEEELKLYLERET